MHEAGLPDVRSNSSSPLFAPEADAVTLAGALMRYRGACASPSREEDTVVACSTRNDVHDGPMSTTRNLAVVLAIITVAGCSNTVSSLTYHSPPSVQAAIVPAVSGVGSVDQRKEAPHRIATIMGGFGNPLKTLDTTKPVKDEVAEAFMAGLRARHLSDTAAPYRLILTIRKFDADMIMGSTARIDLTAAVMDRTGHNVFDQTVVDSASDFAFFKTGMFADINDLQRLCQVVLDRTVDKVLDNPAFRQALGPATNRAVSGRRVDDSHFAALSTKPRPL
jgi:hypothetical protein